MFTWKKHCCQGPKAFLTFNLSIITRVAALPLKASRLLPAAIAAYLKTHCICACWSDQPKLYLKTAQEFCHWFVCQILQSSSGIGYGSDCHMTSDSSSLNLNSNLTWNYFKFNLQSSSSRMQATINLVRLCQSAGSLSAQMLQSSSVSKLLS